MIRLLYNIFVYDQNIGQRSISYERIKRLLSNNSSDFENDKLNFGTLFQLLKLGIIEKSGDNRYSLSNSSIITNTENNFTIGVNMPEEILKKNSHLIKKQYLGLTIFHNKKIDVDDYELSKMVFSLNKAIELITPFNILVKNWKPVELIDIGQINQLEKFDSNKCIWLKSKDFSESNKLYKCYFHNEYYFKYLLLHKNKYYLIEPYEYEKVNSLKLMNNNRTLFKFSKFCGELKLKSYHTYPVYLYKILLLNHIMQVGDVPDNNRFTIEFKQFLRISKILTLNYTLE